MVVARADSMLMTVKLAAGAAHGGRVLAAGTHTLARASASGKG